MRHALVTKLLSKEITIEYDNCWEEEIIEAHMELALNSYDKGDHSAGYGSSTILSHIAENEEAKQHFTNLAYLYLDGHCITQELMFSGK
jgi:hypothetical protein